jgi:hemolysin-activating ACP:hemolysin acyltransferase
MIFGPRKGKDKAEQKKDETETSVESAEVDGSETAEASGGEAGQQPNVGAAPDKTRLAREAMQSKMMSAAFGQVVSVLMRSPRYKHYSLSDLEWLAVPAVLTGQFSLAEARMKDRGFSAPVGLALWARVSEEVDEKLSENLSKPVRLRPDEWKSGDIFWLIDLIGEPRVAGSLLRRLGETVFKDLPVKTRARDKEGGPVIRVIGAKDAEESVAK